GWQVNLTRVALVGVGVLFMVIGNVLPRARSNFIFGIRTPWTLSSDTVWTRSNRVAGYSMVAAGLLTAASAFIASPWRFVIVVVSLVVSAILPIVYSYILWSRERGGPASD
ncbi:MAG TPA: SdpI family protein, partial [Gemmatimonadaceae bacterium]|nr:SdpI family protein [Gemmatimonadaceae bacterium]